MKSGRLRTFLPKNFKATLLVCSTGKFPTFTVLIRAGIILAQFCLSTVGDVILVERLQCNFY